MSVERRTQFAHIAVATVIIGLLAWVGPLVAQTAYGVVKGREVRIIDATTPRLAFQDADGTSPTNSQYIDYVLSTNSLDFYTSFSTGKYAFETGSNTILELAWAGSTINSSLTLSSAFNGVGGVHTGDTEALVAGSSEAFLTTNTSDTNAQNWRVLGDGTMEWGVNGSLQDTNLYRNAANELKTDDDFTVAADLDVDGELEGSRSIVSFGTNDNLSADRYLTWGATTSASQGLIAARAGSIVELSGSCDVTVGAVGATFDIEVRVATLNVLELSGLNATSTGVKSDYTTQARGTDTFSAGQAIACRIDINSGAPTVDNCQCHIGIVYDS